ISGLCFMQSLLMVLPRQLMHRFEEGTRMLRIDFRGDAVAEVEHLTAAMTVSRKNTPDFSADCRRVGVEHARVHIALQRHLVADAGTGAADIAGPAQAQRFGTAIPNRLQP